LVLAVLNIRVLLSTSSRVDKPAANYQWITAHSKFRKYENKSEEENIRTGEMDKKEEQRRQRNKDIHDS